MIIIIKIIIGTTKAVDEFLKKNEIILYPFGYGLSIEFLFA